MTEAFPLYWPENRPRTPDHRRQRSRFQTGFGMAVRSVMNELRLLGARLPIISTNVPLRRDGLPLASAKRINDPAAAVYFTYKDRQTCFACDRWDKVEDNIWAIAKTIEAMRGIARWGTGDMLDAAFRGFTALPAPGDFDWRHELRVEDYSPSTRAQAEAAYRLKAKQRHPDIPGGSAEAMARLNKAIEMAREELKADEH